MPELVIRPSAADDLTDILDYIGRDSPTRALSFAQELIRQCEKLASLPGAHGRARPELAAGLRSFAYRKYVVLFRYTGDTFEVVNIIEGHRDIEGMFS